MCLNFFLVLKIKPVKEFSKVEYGILDLIDFLVVLYYFFIKRHVETVKLIPKWFKNRLFWFSLEYLRRFFVSKYFFRLRLKNDLFRLWNRFSLLNDFSLWNVRMYRVKNPEKDSKSRSQKSSWSILIISKRFFDFRLVKNHFRFSDMKSKHEIFDFNFVRFRKPLKNPVETSFQFFFYFLSLSGIFMVLEYLYFSILELISLGAKFFGGEGGWEIEKWWWRNDTRHPSR